MSIDNIINDNNSEAKNENKKLSNILDSHKALSNNEGKQNLNKELNHKIYNNEIYNNKCSDHEIQSSIYDNINSFSYLNFQILQGKLKNHSKEDNNIENESHNYKNSFRKYIEMKEKIKSEINIRENINLDQPINKIKSYSNVNLNEIDLTFNHLFKTENKIQNKENIEKVKSIITERIQSIYTKNELNTMEQLNLSDQDLTDIKELENILISLKDINLNNNKLSSFEGIPSSIVKLSIRNNCINNLIGLSKLLIVRYLDISNNSIKNIDALSSLIHLRDLHADNTGISDITSLFKMKGLINISLQNNNISNFNVEYLNNNNYYWESLNLKNNNIKVINGIEYLKCLKYFNCANNKIKDLKLIHSNPSLKILILSDNYIIDFDGRTFGNLEYLDLDKNCINKISNIYRLSNLKVLYLRYQKNGDINTIEYDHLVNLKEIYISGNNINTLEIFSNNIYLDIFSANTCNINEIPKTLINNLISLKILDLRYNNIETLISLNKESHLKVLLISGNKLKDFYSLIKSLENNNEIEYMDIRYN
ncbi:hypothetical protein U3516DRAFT_850281 [Neocallimastix sp. 'constans']